jgi:hypothetical protein
VAWEDTSSTDEIDRDSGWVSHAPPAPIFGEPLDPRRSIAIPGTYFGARPVERVRQGGSAAADRLPARPSHGVLVRVVLPIAILLGMLALITWYSMGYNGVR